MPIPLKIVDLIPALGLIPHPEGGFFVETWRSGSAPMSTQGQTGLDCDDPDKNLVLIKGRKANRPDGEERRNALTSIYWVPTVKSPRLLLAINKSDHVHYYQGGRPFKYSLFDPVTGKFTQVILGPELHKGHKLQVCVQGGLWKCGKIEMDEPTDEHEYSLIGEAVAPGFDFHDFAWVTKEQVTKECKDLEHVKLFMSFVHDNATSITKEKRVVDAASEFYEENDNKERRMEERAGK